MQKTKDNNPNTRKTMKVKITTVDSTPSYAPRGSSEKTYHIGDVPIARAAKFLSAGSLAWDGKMTTAHTFDWNHEGLETILGTVKYRAHIEAGTFDLGGLNLKYGGKGRTKSLKDIKQIFSNL